MYGKCSLSAAFYQFHNTHSYTGTVLMVYPALHVLKHLLRGYIQITLCSLLVIVSGLTFAVVHPQISAWALLEFFQVTEAVQ